MPIWEKTGSQPAPKESFAKVDYAAIYLGRPTAPHPPAQEGGLLYAGVNQALRKHAGQNTGIFALAKNQAGEIPPIAFAKSAFLFLRFVLLHQFRTPITYFAVPQGRRILLACKQNFIYWFSSVVLPRQFAVTLALVCPRAFNFASTRF